MVGEWGRSHRDQLAELLADLRAEESFERARWMTDAISGVVM